MKKGIPFLAAIFFFHFTFGQSYDLSAGLRLGTEWGISGKYRFADRSTAELILQSSLQREEVVVTALAEQHFPMVTKRMNFYAGGGIHKGWASDNQEVSYEDPFGISLIAGAEITFAKLNISYDFKPAVNISGGEKNVYFQSGVSMRYVLVKRSKPDKEQRQKIRDKKKKKRVKKREKNKKKRGKDEEGKKINWRFWEDWR